jgi:nucleotide-binding universal stress UspA family protein
MIQNFLVAVDGSDNSLRAVEYAGRILAGRPNVRLVLFSVLPVISRLLLDQEELEVVRSRKAERPDLAGLYWRLEDEEKMHRFFADAREVLIGAGVDAEQIHSNFKVKSGEVADAILEEARLGKCQTVIVGRRGRSRVKEFFLGSVSTRVVRMAKGCAVWVVE